MARRTNVTTRVTITTQLELNEIEIRALDGLVGYGIESFLKVFYEKLGKCYMEDHEDGLRSLFERIDKDVRPAIGQIDAARKLLKDAKENRNG